jgi:nucleotide-binding universal stress UspA family protein
VVAVDFSEGASTALGRLRALPLASSPVIHLVHAVPVPTLTPLPVAKEMAEAELRKLTPIVRRHFTRARVTTDVSSGRPADEIARIARERQAELIVAGRRGAGGFPRLMLGSTAERLLRVSRAPVLLVAPDSAAYKHVLMPLDVTEDVAPVLRLAARLLPSAAFIEMLHVYWVYGAGYLAIGGAPRHVIANHRRRVRQQADDAAAPIVRWLKQAGFRATVRLLNGDPRRIVERVLRAEEPDLVVIGNHAQNAVSRALLGSVAAHVLKIATCDILLVPVA